MCFYCSCDFSETSAIRESMNVLFSVVCDTAMRESMKVLFSVVCDSDQFTKSGCLSHQTPALAYPSVLLNT